MMWLKLNQRDIVGLRFAVNVLPRRLTWYVLNRRRARSGTRQRQRSRAAMLECTEIHRWLPGLQPG